jgi:hypothetical protein
MPDCGNEGLRAVAYWGRGKGMRHVPAANDKKPLRCLNVLNIRDYSLPVTKTNPVQFRMP